MSVFVDTGAFLAYRNKRDKYHEFALKLFTDAVSIEIMKEFNIEKYFGFDSHFNGIVESLV